MYKIITQQLLVNIMYKYDIHAYVNAKMELGNDNISISKSLMQKKIN